jgi:hypothetical protein
MSQKPRKFANALPNGFKIAGVITLLTGLGIGGLIPGYGAMECNATECTIIRGRAFAKDAKTVPLANIKGAGVSTMGRKSQPVLYLKDGTLMPLVQTADSTQDYAPLVEGLKGWLKDAWAGRSAPLNLVFNTGMGVIYLGGALVLSGIAFFIFGIRRSRLTRSAS